MQTIQKAPETMTARERVKRTFAFEKTDRVPIDYCANPVIHKRLMAALGARDDEQLRRMLGVDFRGIHAPYAGPQRFPEKAGRQVSAVYGHYTRRVENKFGSYEDFCDFPLQNAPPEAFAAYPFPSADEFDCDRAVASMAQYPDCALYAGSAGIPDIINSMGRIMGMEDILVALYTEDAAVLDLLDRKLDLELGVLERLLEKAKGRIDFLWLGEDLGTQHAPMISLELYRRVLRPRHARFVDLGKAYGLPVMVHTCGASSWAYEDFIEMGVAAVDTLQPEATDMSPESLCARFGGRLSFHGCISTAGPLAYGTAQETAQICRETLAAMRPFGGYHFAPSHAIQDNSPVENVIAMYQTAHEVI